MKKLSRRDFLRTAGTAAAGLAAVNLIGCAPAKPTAAAEQNPGTSASANDKLFLNYWTGWSGNGVRRAAETRWTSTTLKNSRTLCEHDHRVRPVRQSAHRHRRRQPARHRFGSLAAPASLHGRPRWSHPPDQLCHPHRNMNGKEYWPNVWDAWHCKGDLWGIAITVNASTFAYRRDIFKEVGLDPDKPPKTMARTGRRQFETRKDG